MLSINITKIFARTAGNGVKSLININTKKEFLIDKIKAYRFADNLKILDFSNIDDNGFVKYDDTLIKNHTTPDLHKKGITILELIATRDTSFDMHEHHNQTQFIYVTSGKIAELHNNMFFTQDMVYLVPKKQKHMVMYYQGASAMIIYMPNLELINDVEKN